MNTFNVPELQNGNYFTNDVFLDKKFLLITPGVPLSEEVTKALLEWDFFKLYSEGHPVDKPTIRAIKGTSTDTSEDSTSKKKEKNDDVEITEVSDASDFSRIERVYGEYQSFISEVYTRYATHKELQLQVISDKVKDLCEFIKENKRFVLRIEPSPESRDKNYLVVHSMRSTVFAIVIALQLKFPIHKLIELGVSCILHEIGMIRLPPQLYMGNKVLTPLEKNAIFTHPVISYNILREFSFPLNICLGVLEHHERENGEGYPRKLGKEKISLYAKIIAVACSFEAATASRPYKEAQDTYSGIIDIMKNQGKQYDETIIRALLFSVSLYPIGLYVLLSNGKNAQVIDVNPENPKYPIVQIVGELKPDGTPKIVGTSEYGLNIIRPLTKDEGSKLPKKEQ
ncbi:MAG TPA: HD-GYP domain-containing protein [Treponemataceae bacterium]|nr:HD-GYP domain-containing protein [Treponemataceae bacterium]